VRRRAVGGTPLTCGVSLIGPGNIAAAVQLGASSSSRIRFVRVLPLTPRSRHQGAIHVHLEPVDVVGVDHLAVALVKLGADGASIPASARWAGVLRLYL
jgi:hypothetical protein